MKTKLVKKGDYFYCLIFIDNKELLATTEENVDGVLKLSLKNCLAIESGYDLDEDYLEELAEDMLQSKDWDNDITLPFNGGYIRGVIDGFQKAFDLLGDKKFTVNDMRRMMLATSEWLNSEMEYGADELLKRTLKSIQQTEWDVEIEMENTLENGYKNQPANTIGFVAEHKSVPKLDAEGCLILKRVE